MGLATLIALLGFANVDSRARPITLPIEVAGESGSTESVHVTLPNEANSLWLQTHGVSFPGMVSVQVNESPWTELSNSTAQIAEPGKSYGGIGGGYATLKMTVPLAPGASVAGDNTIRFRFNHTNGIASGFRIVAFNFTSGAGAMLLREEDPNLWQPQHSDRASIAAGRKLWFEGALVADGRPNAPPIRAHCGGCHAQDGRDLKYFNFSNTSIAARARFHGLTAEEGDLIASYIRALPGPNPGRPWIPPFQPGGVDLDDDGASMPFIFGPRITAATFRPDGDLKAGAIPIAFQLPDWNHWLPRVHPIDAWGQTPELGHALKFLKARTGPRVRWTPDLTGKVYATQLWQLVKTWERNQESGEDSWGSIPASTAPEAAHIPDGSNGMNGSALSNQYFNAAWYQLQILLSDKHKDADYPYLIAQFLTLQRESHRAEPARLLIAIIKAMQSADARVGPENYERGWRPERNISPAILVDPVWAPEFDKVPPVQRKAIIAALLTAWLDKNDQYRPSRYFERAVKRPTYQWPANLRNAAGVGSAWNAADAFRSAGVDSALVLRLKRWGETYQETAARFAYSGF